MNRKEAAELLPIIKAFSEGKTIQVKQTTGEWVSFSHISHISFDSEPKDYRIKPEPKYRPFKDKEECWKEMLQHSPLGWVKFQGDWLLIVHIDDKSIGYGSACGAIIHSKFDSTLKSFTFADGTPFGILEEE